MVFGQERVARRCGASQAMRDAVRKPWETAVPVARANRRRASESLAEVPHRPRLSSYPADRPPDLYGSLSRTFGMSPEDLEARLRGIGGVIPNLVDNDP